MRWHFINHKEASYLVIPNLSSCTEAELPRALAINQLAGVLDDLDLVRWPKPGWPEEDGKWLKRGFLKEAELQKLRKEEEKESDTDLTKIEQQWSDKIAKTDGGAVNEKGDAVRKETPIRNHGLFSKAENALTKAGWSEQARRDIEIFRV